MGLNQKWSLSSRLFSFARREIVIGLVIVVTAALATLLGTQVADRVAALRAAPQDNVQWTLAQLDVDLLALNVAADQASDAQPTHLAELRKRFKLFEGHVATTSALALFQDKSSEAIDELNAAQSILATLTPTIESTDQTLIAVLPELMADIEQLKPLSHQVSLKGVSLYRAQVDANRSDFTNLLEQAALVNSLLILALGASLLFLLRQMSISKQRAAELEASSDRNASTVNASLDAIIVTNMKGEVIEFNPAASRIFGYSRNAAIGKQLEEMIIPERFRACHRDGLDHLKATSENRSAGASRMEMLALKEDGTEFPVEMALGMTSSPGEQLVIGFLRDISQRDDQDRALRAAHDEALEAARVKSQFMAIMSHEMRTPLNGVMAVLDLLQTTKLNSRQKTYVKTAATSAEILKQHVDDVLDLTRIQAGKLEFHPRTFNLAELLEEVRNINAATAATRGNIIDLNVEIVQPYFIADRKRIHQVLTNLIGNAIKFTENGVIRIDAKFLSVKADNVMVEFQVQDSGIGIAKRDQDRIFEDFVTLDATYQRSAEGAGLGLTISRSIVEGMNGTMGVESELGRGSRFWFRIPLKAALPKLGIEVKQENSERKRHSSRLLKVLVVEDNETNRFVAEELLRGAHCHVVLARDGLEGTTAAARQRFDLILMDLSMPRLNGWDAARRIRQSAHSKSKHAPIFALTAHALPEEQGTLFDAGMQGCILKPLRARELNGVLANVRQNASVRDARTMASETLRDSMIDQIITDELAELLGPKAFAEKLQQFITELESAPRRLLRLTTVERRQELGMAAHRLAGSASVFGARNLLEFLQSFETSLPKMTLHQTECALQDVQDIARCCQSYYGQLMASSVLNS